MHACPNCAKPGIGFFAKLLSNPIYPAVCRFCGERATKSALVIKIQMAIALGYLVFVPNLLPGDTAYALGTVTALLIIGIGQIGPMRRVLT